MISGAKILLAKEWLTGSEAIHLLSELIKDSISVTDFISFARRHDIPAYALSSEIALLDFAAYLDRKVYAPHKKARAITLVSLQKGENMQEADTDSTQAECHQSNFEYPHTEALKGFSYSLMYSDRYCKGDIYFRLLGVGLTVEGRNRAGELTRWEVNTNLLGAQYQLPAHFLPDDMKKLANFISSGTPSGAPQPVTARSGWYVKPPNRIDDLAESILKVLYQEQQKEPDHPPLISEVVTGLISSGVLRVKNNNHSQFYLNDSSKEPITQGAMKARIKRYIEQ